jgi:hypothetical protein
MISKIIACVSCFTAIAAIAATPAGNVNPHINLLGEFRPIGAGGNNLQNPELNPIPGSPELNIAP